MTDKELIKQEIERRINEYKNWIGYQTDSNYLELKELLQFIDSLPEEPASENLAEEFNRFLDEEEGVPRMWHSDEQMEWGMDIARHFAEWQKQKDLEDAVDATVLDVDAQTIEFGLWPEKLLDIKEGDKVKIIIVKEEQQ